MIGIGTPISHNRIERMTSVSVQAPAAVEKPARRWNGSATGAGPLPPVKYSLPP